MTGRWTDVAEWRGPIPNCGPGRMSAHMGVVIHTAEGSYDGTIAWQRNPAADVGSHFVTAQDGRCVQLIDTDIRSWCQSAGNDAWLSVENAGFGSRGEALTAGQVEACARILARAHREYGVPLQVSNSPSTRGLGWHGMGGAAWGGHTGCPGTAIRAQLPAIVARAAQIVGGATASAHTVGEIGMVRLLLTDNVLDALVAGPSPAITAPAKLRISSHWGGCRVWVYIKGVEAREWTVFGKDAYLERDLPPGTNFAVKLLSTVEARIETDPPTHAVVAVIPQG